MIAGHYAGCCCAWPSREVYYILNIAHLFPCPGTYYYAQQVSRHDSRSASPPHTLKVITMGCMKSRWDLEMTGSDREPQTGHPLCLPQIKGDSSTLLCFPVIPSRPLFLAFLLIYHGLLCLLPPPPPHYYALRSLHLLRH